MKRQEFKITKEMKEDPDFNFAVFVYENTEDAVYVNEDSLEFLDEQRNLANPFNDTVYFSMSYYTKEDITNDEIDEKTKEILLNVLKEKGEIKMEKQEFKVTEKPVLSSVQIEILKTQGSYGYMLPIELGVEIVQGKTWYIVGEDLNSFEYSYEIFETIEEAEEAFDRRLSARR